MEDISKEYLTSIPTKVQVPDHTSPTPSMGPAQPNIRAEPHDPSKREVNVKSRTLVTLSVISVLLIMGLAAAQMWYISTLVNSFDQLKHDIEAIADKTREIPHLSATLVNLTEKVESQRRTLDTISRQMMDLISAWAIYTSSPDIGSSTIGKKATVPVPTPTTAATVPVPVPTPTTAATSPVAPTTTATSPVPTPTTAATSTLPTTTTAATSPAPTPTTAATSPAPTPTTSASCDQLDIAFLIDSSGSINRNDYNNWDRLLTFVSEVVNRFTVGPNNIQFSAVKYSYSVSLEFKLNTYSIRQDVVDHILDLSHADSTTNIAAAIETARQDIFTDRMSDGDRPGVQNVIILITDGVPSERVRDTLPQANAAKSEGIYMVSVGISDEIDVNLLRNISSDNSLLSVGDFNELGSIVTDLTGAVC